MKTKDTQYIATTQKQRRFRGEDSLSKSGPAFEVAVAHYSVINISVHAHGLFTAKSYPDNTVLVLMILDLIINYSEAEPTYKQQIKYCPSPRCIKVLR